MPKIPFSPDAGVTNFMIDNRFALIPSTDLVFPLPGEVVFTLIPIGVFAIGVMSAVVFFGPSLPPWSSVRTAPHYS